MPPRRQTLLGALAREPVSQGCQARTAVRKESPDPTPPGPVTEVRGESTLEYPSPRHSPQRDPETRVRGESPGDPPQQEGRRDPQQPRPPEPVTKSRDESVIEAVGSGEAR